MIDENKLIQDIHNYFKDRIDKSGLEVINNDVLTLNKEICEIVKNQPKAEAETLVHCKDCIWWEDEHVLLSDGNRRPYTEEEKKNCPTGVTCDIGINVGSRCMVNPYITNLFRNSDDYCSRADMRKKVY